MPEADFGTCWKVGAGLGRVASWASILVVAVARDLDDCLLTLSVGRRVVAREEVEGEGVEEAGEERSAREDEAKDRRILIGCTVDL